MNAFDRIRAVLDAARHRLRRYHSVRAGLYGAAGWVLLASLAPLGAYLLAPHHGPRVGILALLCALLMLALVIALGRVVPGRRFGDDRRMARYVGEHVPQLASDLLSAVELGRAQAQPSAEGAGSPELTEAFLDHTAARVSAIDLGGLDAHAKRRRLARAALVFAAAGAATTALWVSAPRALSQGAGRMLARPASGPFAGASLVIGPLVGDMRVRLEFPAYTQKPPQVLSSTSGDFRALPGTAVTIETRALAPVQGARVLFGDGDAAEPTPAPAGVGAAGATPTTDETGAAEATAPAGTAPGSATAEAATEAGAARSSDGPAGAAYVAAEVGADQHRLEVDFVVSDATRYRFWLEGVGGARRVESQPRQIELEVDQAPTVELFAPADELDVSRQKRVELAYIAEDDYGIGEISLVWESAAGGGRKALPLPAQGRRSAQDKLVWDLSELDLEPEVPVRYHIEVSDNNTVSGPKRSQSRSYMLRVFSPRERHQQLIERQRALFESLLLNLGARLVLPTPPAGDLRDYQQLLGATDVVVVEIGALLVSLGEDPLADQALRDALDEIRADLSERASAERRALTGLVPGAPVSARLGEINQGLVEALEADVLTLADWLDRQRMETMLAISDEVKGHQKRLSELFEELQRTGGSEALQAEIERELRNLEARLAELADQRSVMPEDVLDRFVNQEALPDQEDHGCMAEVRELLAAGQHEAAAEAMERCTAGFDRAAEAMEQALRALRGERFSEAERKLAALMSDLSSLAEDQAKLARDADALWERYAARADEMMQGKVEETRRQADKILEKLQRRLQQVPERHLTPFAKEEFEIVGSRLRDVREMLDDGDIAEALAMAKQAREGIEIMAEELDAALMDEADQPWGERTREAARVLRRALPLADELVQGLAAHTPAPEEIMSRDDRRQLERMRRRQQSFRERARRLGKRAGEQGGELPGEAGQAVASGVERADQEMGRAAERMGQRDPSGARHESRAAAETLEQTVEGARGAARRRQASGRGGLRDEPIRIPGAEEYRAPEQFREDILEAMRREEAPSGFGEMVKRYYEELIR